MNIKECKAAIAYYNKMLSILQKEEEENKIYKLFKDIRVNDAYMTNCGAYIIIKNIVDESLIKCLIVNNDIISIGNYTINEISKLTKLDSFPKSALNKFSKYGVTIDYDNKRCL